MTSEWKTEPLRNVISYIAKGIPPVYAEQESNTTVRVLNQKCNRNFVISYEESRLHDFSKRSVSQEKYLRDNDILINSTGTGTVGRIAQLYTVPCPTIVDGHMIVIRARENVVPRYLGYALKAHQAEILQLDEGSTGQTELNRERLLSEIKISYPISLNEQRAIATTLSCLDDKIELNNEINANLEAQAQVIFKSWFVNFEPFCDGEFVNSELGPIPKGWRIGKLNELITICSGKRPLSRNSSKNMQYSIPLIGASSMMGYTSNYLYDSKILVIGRVGTHGIVQRINKKCWPSDNTLVITSNYYEFVYQVLKRIDYNELNRGTTQPLITQTDIRNVLTVIPPVKLLNQYELMIQIYFDLFNNLSEQSEKLSNLRDTLIPKIVSGKIETSIRR